MTTQGLPARKQRYDSDMPSPFPGMDPYLEHPALWPDVHNSLLAAIRDEVAADVAPRYYVALERRVYALKPGDVPMADEVEEVFIEVREVTTGRCVTVLELLSPTTDRSASDAHPSISAISSRNAAPCRASYVSATPQPGHTGSATASSSAS